MAREMADRLPVDYWATEEVTDRLMSHLRCDDAKALYRELSIDKVVKQVPYRPDILGYIDLPSRYMAYGGKGAVIGALR